MATTGIRRSPTRIRVSAVLGLAAAMIGAAALITITLPDQALGGLPFTIDLPLIIVIATVAELASVDRRLDGHNHTLSLSEVSLVIGLAYAAPVTLVVGRVIAGLIAYGAIKRLPPLKLTYNTGIFALETAAATTVFHALIDTQPIHEPAAWIALGAAIAAATIIGLGAVRLILKLHGTEQRLQTALFSIAITAIGTTAGILSVIALAIHTEAAVLVVILSAFTYLAVSTIARLMDRLALFEAHL